MASRSTVQSPAVLKGLLSGDSGAGLVAGVPAAVGAEKRTLQNMLDDFYSLKAFGVSNSGVESSAQMQAAIDSGEKLFAPPGEYKFSNVKLPHSGSYFRVDSGVVLVGAGPGKVKFTTGDSAMALDYTDEDTYKHDFLFLVHGSHHKLSGFFIEDAKGGIYLGQDAAEVGVEQSSVAFCEFSNLVIKNVGTGILAAATDPGIYFNEFRNVHLAQCQFGIHTKKGKHALGSSSTFNRNYFDKVRVARCHVGAGFEHASTNFLQSVEIESCKSVPTNNGYSYPSAGTAFDIAHGDGIGLALDSSCEHNNICVINEGCDRPVQDEGQNQQWMGGVPRLLENVNSNRPAVLLDRNGIIQKDYIHAVSNAIGGEHKAGQINLLANVAHFRDAVEVNEHIIEYGDIAAGASNTMTIQGDASGLADTTAMLEVLVAADCSASSLGFAKKFTIVVKRNGSRTLIRYHIFSEENMRVNGVNSGDSSEPLGVALSASGKDLQLQITAPGGRSLDRVTVFFKEVVNGHRV